MAKGRPTSWDTQTWTEDRPLPEGTGGAGLGAGALAIAVVLALVAGVVGGGLVSVLLPGRGGGGGGGGGPSATFHLDAYLSGFKGLGGAIDGMTNPDLVVAVGTSVTIVVMNAEAFEHDFFLDGYLVHINGLMSQGAERSATFTADEAGSFTYYCTIPGHRATMQGTLIVGEPSKPGPGPAKAVDTGNIGRNPADVPPPITRTTPATVHLYLESREVVAEIEPGSTFSYWTFNGTVPGPFFRVRTNDTVVIHFRNAASSTMNHSVDFHAVTGPGGGAVATQTAPGQVSDFSFKAIMPGLYVYHCASPHIPTHISAGMYGLILVQPEVPLPPVDREYYMMQGDLYTKWPAHTPGHQEFDTEALLREDPTYVVFNGKWQSLTGSRALTATVGERIRVYFGVGGPNLVSSWHLIGEMFDYVWNLGDVLSPPMRSVQTVLVPPGGAVIVDIIADYPADYVFVDHSLTRTIDKGCLGVLKVTGTADPTIYNP